MYTLIFIVAICKVQYSVSLNLVDIKYSAQALDAENRKHANLSLILKCGTPTSPRTKQLHSCTFQMCPNINKFVIMLGNLA